MKRTILILICTVCFSIFGKSQTDWKLTLDKNNIQVYLRDIEGSTFKEFRGETTVKARLSSFAVAIRDIDNFTNWSYKSKKAKILKSQDHSIYMHVITEAPWPIKNRDVVYFSNIFQDSISKALTITLKCTPNYIPIDNNYIRVQKSDGFWKFIPQENGFVKVIFQVHAEPGGGIPSWLSNLAVVESPYQTISKILEEIKKPEYRDAQCDFVTEPK